MKEPETAAGMIKKAFIPSTFLRSSEGMRGITSLIFSSADVRFEGWPVIIAEPLSAANSLYLERARMSRKLATQTAMETIHTSMRPPESRLLPPKAPK